MVLPAEEPIRYPSIAKLLPALHFSTEEKPKSRYGIEQL
jgi:hypothetical protein